MHLRKLVLACGFASFALSNYAGALGLGEVKLKSTLNEPFRAEVQLLDTRGLTAEQIIVGLASPADFERNGVERLYFYTEFQFQVVLDNPGGPIVRVTTRNPVREPYLNFLVEARWTAGRLLREYTVLMDLPTFDEAVPQAVQGAATTKSTSSSTTSTKKLSPTPAPVDEILSTPPSSVPETEEKPDIIAEQEQTSSPATSPESTAPQSTETQSKVSGGTYGPIGNNDTLWEIARAVRPDSSVTVHQTMLALQRLNPDAFIRNNINLIKKGQVLRVPDASEIANVSKAEAVTQVNSQINEWSGTSTASTGLGAQLDASSNVERGSRKAEPVAGRVKLEAPSASDGGNGNASGANKGTGKALETELAATLEELDKAKSEKTELSSRVRDLEDQLQTMQRLVDVSNEKLRAMQITASKEPEKVVEQQPVVPTPVPSSVAASIADQTSSIDVSSVGTTPEAAVVPTPEAVVVPTPEPTVAPKKVAPKPVVKPKPVEKTLVDKITDNIVWVGLGLLVLLGAVFAVFRSRKSKSEEAARSAESEDLFSSEPNFDSFNQAPDDVPEPEEPIDEAPLFEEEETAVAETGDVVGEADIYIAYGKYDQAEEMLLNGLAKDPHSADIRLKLLEVYSQTQNASEFDKHYAALLPIATAFALNRAAELRTNIPDAGDFAGATPAHFANTAPSTFDEDFDLDDDFSDGVLKPEPSAKKADEMRFDFDDDVDSDVKVASGGYDLAFTGKHTPANTTEDDFILDFDLDETNSKADNKAEDLSEISLALDDLDRAELANDIEPSKPDADDDFTFDFNEVDDDNEIFEPEIEAAQTTRLTTGEESLGDDFNLEMDVNDLDLAALDHEMESLDADLDALDDEDLELEPVAEVDDFIADNPASTTTTTTTTVTKTTVVEQHVEAEEELLWEEDGEDDEPELFAPNEPAADELAIDNDDFDLDDTNLAEFDTDFDDDLNETAEEPALFTAEDKVEPTSDDALFDEALAEFSADDIIMDENSDMSDDDMDAELDFMADADEAATKLDLARAYIDMGDNDGARDILAEVAHEGNDQQRQEAVDLLSRIDV